MAVIVTTGTDKILVFQHFTSFHTVPLPHLLLAISSIVDVMATYFHPINISFCSEYNLCIEARNSPVGDSRQPCRTPRFIIASSDSPFSSLTKYFWVRYKILKNLISLPGSPTLKMFSIIIWFTLSNAFS